MNERISPCRVSGGLRHHICVASGVGLILSHFHSCSSPTSATPLYGFFVRPRAWVHHGVDVLGYGEGCN